MSPRTRSEGEQDREQDSDQSSCQGPSERGEEVAAEALEGGFGIQAARLAWGQLADLGYQATASAPQRVEVSVRDPRAERLDAQSHSGSWIPGPLVLCP